MLRLGERLTVLNHAAVGGHRGLLITGPPGSGKTTALQELGRHFEHVDRSQHPGGILRASAVYLRVHPSDSSRTVLFNLAGLLAYPLPTRASTASASGAVRDALLSSGTRVVLVDDVFAALGSSSASRSPVDTLHYLADQVPATFVYAGLEGQEDSLPAAFRTGQSRLTHLRAAPVPYDACWEILVETLDRALRLYHHRPGSLVQLAQVLHERTGGWPGALVHLVRSAAIDAILTGSEEITERDLDVIAV